MGAELPLLAEDEPEGKGHDQDEQEVERPKVGIYQPRHGVRHGFHGSLLLCRSGVELLTEGCTELRGRGSDVAGKGRVAEEDEDGCEQEEAAEGVDVVLPPARQIVANEEPGAIEEFEQRARQRALQPDSVHDEGAPEVVPGDALCGVALSAAWTVGALEIVAAVQAVLRVVGLRDALLGESALSDFLTQFHAGFL